MKLLHTSDWHLGRIFHERPLAEDQAHFLDQIFGELSAADAAGRPYDALLVPGDIYDRPVPPTDAVRLLSGFLQRLRDALPALEVFLLAGNHDSASRLSFAAGILASQKIHICTDTAGFTTPTIIGAEGGAAAVYQLPFLSPGSISDESAPAAEQPLRTQQELLSEACRRIQAAHQARFPQMPSVLCAHAFAQSAHTGGSERRFIGTAEQVDAALFDGFTYAALGHLHKSQPCGRTGRAFYSGAPLAYNFDDPPDTSMLRVELNGTDAPSVEKIPFRPLHRIARLEGPFQRFYGAGADRQLIAEHKDDYVQIVCTDPVLPQSPIPLLRKNFPLALSFIRKASEPGAASAAAASLEERRSVISSNDGGKPEKIYALFLKDAYGGSPPQDGALADAERALFLKAAEQYSWEEST
ncbi:MAG: exonuclease SbcCD subunit D [Treponemataceae bacterium]|nr:exonuclease SbcCD subunit D [Treponemataceae bacterium]